MSYRRTIAETCVDLYVDIVQYITMYSNVKCNFSQSSRAFSAVPWFSVLRFFGAIFIRATIAMSKLRAILRICLDLRSRRPSGWFGGAPSGYPGPLRTILFAAAGRQSRPAAAKKERIGGGLPPPNPHRVSP